MPVHAMATSAAELDVVGCRQHRLPRRPDLGGAIVDGVAHTQDLGCRVGGVAPCACLLERGDRARLEVSMRDRHGGESRRLLAAVGCISVVGGEAVAGILVFADRLLRRVAEPRDLVIHLLSQGRLLDRLANLALLDPGLAPSIAAPTFGTPVAAIDWSGTIAPAVFSSSSCMDLKAPAFGSASTSQQTDATGHHGVASAFEFLVHGFAF